VVSANDLSPLIAAFKAAGVYALHGNVHGTGGLWYATCESGSSGCSAEPEVDIQVLLAAIESLTPPVREQWLACSLREFNIGYDCGEQPWAFNNGLSARTLRRVADAGASLRITLYPAVMEDEIDEDEA
jgi:hypothetical protein